MKRINGWTLLTFSAKSSIFNILLGPENASGFSLNYFHQKLHLWSLKGLTCICIYLVQQFWRWINKMSKVCYEETQKNGYKYVVSENSSSKNLEISKKNIPMKLLFKTKLQVTWHFLGMFFWEIYEIFRTAFTKITLEWWLLQLVMTRKCLNQNIFFKKYLNRIFWFMVWYSMACVPRD